jgi:hypothetical protein
MANANQTFITYEGPSLYDGKPIVVLVQTGSSNRKTGDMVQTYILRSDIDPITASRMGEDSSICGTCPHMGTPNPDSDKGQAIGRTCYVTLAHGPLGKYKAYKAGRYDHAIGHDKIRALGLGRMVRLGTYGDPAAVPQYIWDSLTSACEGWTAYTHGEVNPAPDMIMTSAESASQAQAAWGRGERTFRVIAGLDSLIKGKEVLCPASEEAGMRTTCESCKLCAGASVKAKSVAIVAHGIAKRKAKTLVE